MGRTIQRDGKKVYQDERGWDGCDGVMKDGGSIGESMNEGWVCGIARCIMDDECEITETMRYHENSPYERRGKGGWGQKQEDECVFFEGSLEATEAGLVYMNSDRARWWESSIWCRHGRSWRIRITTQRAWTCALVRERRDDRRPRSPANFPTLAAQARASRTVPMAMSRPPQLHVVT